jgi:tRNA threonylcarbamoyladenosine biosynthesis protein TsaE
MELETISYEDTLRLGRILAGLLSGGDIVALDGDLGAGKTALVKGIVEGLGFSDQVSSPTFTILHEYSSGNIWAPDTSKDSGIKKVYHFDVYRLAGEEDFYSLGFDEYIFDPSAVSLIEWAERIESSLPDSHIHIRMYRSNNEDDIRRINIEWEKCIILKKLLIRENIRILE